MAHGRTTDIYLKLSGAVFALIGVMHLGRAILGIPVRADGWEFPFWLSWPGGAAALLLSLWGFRLSRSVDG